MRNRAARRRRAWWIWPLALFAVSFALGVVAVVAGVGGGVLFVPIVGSFFPFHLDFVRGAGLLLALSGALAAGAAPAAQRPRQPAPGACRSRSSGRSPRSSARCSGSRCRRDVGAGRARRSPILAIAALMWRATACGRSDVAQPDALAAALRMHGAYHDAAAQRATIALARAPHAGGLARLRRHRRARPACSAWARAGPTCRRSTC